VYNIVIRVADFSRRWVVSLGAFSAELSTVLIFELEKGIRPANRSFKKRKKRVCREFAVDKIFARPRHMDQRRDNSCEPLSFSDLKLVESPELAHREC
jgi:hypothetical protein